MNWKTIRIGNIGKVITGNTPPKKNLEFYGDDFKFIKPTDMNIGARYTPETEEKYSLKAYEKYKKSLIPPLSTCVVTIGRTDEYDPFFIFYAIKNLYQMLKKQTLELLQVERM